MNWFESSVRCGRVLIALGDFRFSSSSPSVVFGSTFSGGVVVAVVAALAAAAVHRRRASKSVWCWMDACIGLEGENNVS